MSTAIKRERIKTGLTQEEAASKLGIHPTTLNKYEGGSRIPSGKVLKSMGQENKELQSRIIQLLDENISLREGSLKKQTSLKKKLA